MKKQKNQQTAQSRMLIFIEYADKSGNIVPDMERDLQSIGHFLSEPDFIGRDDIDNGKAGIKAVLFAGLSEPEHSIDRKSVV